jgi:putative transcriptional regulator
MKNCLKRIREKEYKMDLMEFAIFLGVNYKTYFGWETEKSQPSLEVAVRIARKLERHVDDIWNIY